MAREDAISSSATTVGKRVTSNPTVVQTEEAKRAREKEAKVVRAAKVRVAVDIPQSKRNAILAEMVRVVI